MEITNPPNISNTSPSTSFGMMLSRAREKKQVSLDEVAKELFILKRHLQALEQEDFNALPQMTFARGFAINYAKYLGLDTHQVAESFDAAYPQELRTKALGDIESPLRPMGTLQREGRSKIRFNPLLLVAIIAIIALAVFLLRMIGNAKDEPVEPASTNEIITPAEQAEGAAIEGAGVAIGNANSANNSGAVINNNENSNGAQGSGVAVGNAGAAINGENLASDVNANVDNVNNATLDFWVQNNTDIQVVDATGNTLMTGTQPRGGYKLEGIPPFKVQINKVSNVSLNLNQQPIRLAQYANNNQASFNLAP